MKKYLVVFCFLLVLAGVVFAAFTDVADDTNYSKAITWLQENGVVEGYAVGDAARAFRPEREINRAEFLKMLYESLGGVEATGVGFGAFPDVVETDWYAKYVEAAYNGGVVNGYPDGTFKPSNSINRAEALKIVSKQFFGNQPLEYFAGLSAVAKLDVDGCDEDGHFLADVTTNTWFESYFYFAHSRCLIPLAMIGDNDPPYDDLVYPDALLTRGEMAELIYRAKALKDNALDQYVADLVPNNLIEPDEEILEDDAVEDGAVGAEGGDVGAAVDANAELPDGGVGLSGDATELSSGADSGVSDSISGVDNAVEMILLSTAFKEGERIPEKYTCDGENINPPLSFEDVPPETKAFALIVDDPDAPLGLWYHWTLWDFDGSVTEIAENSVPAGAVLGPTSFGAPGYGGPCPPAGPEHRYFFKLYALDAKIALSPDSSAATITSTITAHAIEEAYLMGKYSRR